MSYVNQDPDIVADPRLLVPFKGHNIVQTTKRAWLEDLAQTQCWCGESPGSCPDCQDCDALAQEIGVHSAGKINIGSGEDANMYR